MGQSKELHFTKAKLLLYLVVASLCRIWYDVWGVWIVPLGLYFLSLVIVPGKAKDYTARMQVRSFVVIYFIILSLPVVSLWFLWTADRRYCGGWPVLKLVYFLYAVWANTLDAHTPTTGRRMLRLLRQTRFWGHVASYFPVTLQRSVPLDPKKNYLFGYHPHGIISVGALCNFATSATGFDELFPGLDLRLLTLAMNFKVPLLREYLMGMGINSASRQSCITNLTRGPGASVMLVVGGAAESLRAGPGKFELVLKDRKGFVKVALVAGASLVPVVSFGETDYFETVEHSWLHEKQLWLQKKLGFAVPLFYGRALRSGLLHRLFGLNVGVMPFRMPITTVVGRPVDCPRVREPTQEQIDKHHALYIEELTRLYNEHKGAFREQRNARLEVLKDVAPGLLESKHINLKRSHSLHFVR